MKYFWATIKHKWFVLLASFKTGLPLWLAITHDLSKFSRHELFHYDRRFFDDKKDPEGFAIAWAHHTHCNDHHPEHWIAVDSRFNHGAVLDCFLMTDEAILHMITDWLGAGRSYAGSWDISKWVASHLPIIKVHPATMIKIVKKLENLDLWHDNGELFKVI